MYMSNQHIFKCNEIKKKKTSTISIFINIDIYSIILLIGKLKQPIKNQTKMHATVKVKHNENIKQAEPKCLSNQAIDRPSSPIET